MLVPLTQLLRVIKVYFPLALPGPKGINVEFTAQRSEDRSQKSEVRDQTSEDRDLKTESLLWERLSSRDLAVSTNFLIL